MSEPFVESKSKRVYIGKNPLEHQRGYTSQKEGEGIVKVRFNHVEDLVEFYVDNSEVSSSTWFRFLNGEKTDMFPDDSLVLDHFVSPEKGEGYGSLGLALFWACLVLNGKDRFLIRFGGGPESKAFLKNLGFDQLPSRYVNEIRDRLATGEHSMMIGDIGEYKRGREGQWSHIEGMRPIKIEYFPIGFFETNLSANTVSKYGENSLFRKLNPFK